MEYRPSTYTVESVTSGHPDKVCDAISDAVLDACLAQDPMSRVAVETFGCNGLLVLGGEVRTKAEVDYAGIARRTYRDIGYADSVKVILNVVRQSPDIAQGVDTGGAGDQGIMYGYATDETPEMLPRGVVLAHALVRRLEEVRRNGSISWLGPDGKAQVTFIKGRLRTVLVSAQHQDGIPAETIRKEIEEKVIRPVIGDDERPQILVNPTGKFVLGGFAADSGLTGRKIMVDTYGGLIPHGGGAFSGKDPTKVDRSAAYMCRFVAKSLLREGVAKKEALVSVSYAIGKPEPLMVEAVDGEGNDLFKHVRDRFDFRPNAIIETLGLRTPIYKRTSAYGHFGKEGLPWESV